MTQVQKPELPSAITPRPGEKVVLYENKTRFEGEFYGYNASDDLLIRHCGGGTIAVDDFRKIRLKDPGDRVNACWNSLPKEAIQTASAEERSKLDHLLGQHMVPGPRYIDFIWEIWARGYEVFLVGGSVRDALNGDDPNDVDLVTTMPFFLVEPIVEAMFGHDAFSRSRKNGFMSVGHGAAKRADQRPSGSLIDLKNIFQFAPGTEQAEFGADLKIDISLRDFACNAVYYDPINHIFIDPCTRGIRDAKEKVLHIVNDTKMEHPTFKKAAISLRFFKFILRGYSPTEECKTVMVSAFKPLIFTMDPIQARRQFHRFLLAKIPEHEQLEAYYNIKRLMKEFDFEDIWTTHFASLEAQYKG